MQALTLLQKFFSVDMVIYAAIVLVAATALVRCTMPLSRVAARLRRAARTIVTESKQNKEKKSWNDMHFLGDSLSATWADFLQNAEMRDAHGETCDVTQYINEDTVIYALGRTGFAGLAPGVMTSLGILGTFMGLVMGLSGLSLTGADTEVVLTAMDQPLGHLPRLDVQPKAERFVRNGNRLTRRELIGDIQPGQPTRLYLNGQFCGIGRFDGETLKFDAMLLE